MKKIKLGLELLLHIFFTLLIPISIILFIASYELETTYLSTDFERILYSLINTDNFKTSLSSFNTCFAEYGYYFIVLLCLFSLPLCISLIFPKEVYIKLFKHKFLIYPIYLKRWSLLLFIISFSSILLSLNFPKFLLNNIIKSNLYEQYYIEYEDDLIKFEGKKRNLITIYVESLENSVFSLENGGTVHESYMPLLEELSGDYINFSNNDKIGGFKQLDGTGWTVAALVGQTSGVPIYIETKNKENKFLDGAISIGEVLEDNGYNNYFLMGSSAKFADRSDYFKQHGDYKISDYYSAIKDGLIHEDYYVWWGYEDRKLYSYAKDKLVEISKNNEPFNFSILTADTHFYDGYLSNNCPKQFEDKYANSYYCTDLMLFDFINWIKEQDFYQDTTIVIVGDHLTMRDDFFDNGNNYERTVYNLFINSVIKTTNTKNRDFSTFDMYPTTLAAIGATIKGDRLALGTNLFANKKTLMEELGSEKFIKEVAKMSNYYKTNILNK